MVLILLNSTIFFYGPIIDLVLYGKMIWLTFILLFFILNNKYIKILMLFLACISDEFGLFSSLIISFSYSFFYFYSLNLKIQKVFILAFVLCFFIFTSINSINAIFFNLGSGFLSFFSSFGEESIRFSTFQRFDSVFVYLLNKIPLLDNNFVLFRENDSLFSPLAMIHYQRYASLSDVHDFIETNKDSIQAIVGHGYIPFGKAQCPMLNDYADGIDTMAFLNSLS
jgi:hypothetical protein